MGYPMKRLTSGDVPWEPLGMPHVLLHGGGVSYGLPQMGPSMECLTEGRTTCATAWPTPWGIRPWCIPWGMGFIMAYTWYPIGCAWDATSDGPCDIPRGCLSHGRPMVDPMDQTRHTSWEGFSPMVDPVRHLIGHRKASRKAALGTTWHTVAYTTWDAHVGYTTGYLKRQFTSDKVKRLFSILLINRGLPHGVSEIYHV